MALTSVYTVSSVGGVILFLGNVKSRVGLGSSCSLENLLSCSAELYEAEGGLLYCICLH